MRLWAPSLLFAAALSPWSLYAQASGAGAASTTAADNTSDSQAVSPMPPEPPEDAGSMIRVSAANGTVDVLNSTGQVLGPATINTSLNPGMGLRTAMDGQAELQFPDGAIVRLAPGSSLSVLGGAEGEARLRPASGLTYFELPPSRLDSVEVPPFLLRAAQGSDPLLFRVSLDSARPQVAVLRGKLRVVDVDDDLAFTAPAENTVTLDPHDAHNYDLAQGITTDSWDAWNTDRDNALAEITSAGHGEGPGWNDLDYYGTWYDVPGAGMAWAPDGVDANFDPYGAGAWQYYTTAGSYSWASAYPWGWLPGHCGIWNWWPGAGWLWEPSGCVWGAGSVWYGVPHLGTGPPRYHHLPRPLPPGGLHPPKPSAQPVAIRFVPVQGAAQGFRVLGGPRPAAREINIAGQPVTPLTPALGSVTSRPGYSSFVGGSASPTYVRSGNVVPRYENPGTYRPPARVSVPAPERPTYSAPPPPPAHFSAPAPAPAAPARGR